MVFFRNGEVMPDWDRLQRFVEHQYSHGKMLSSYNAEGEQTPEQALQEVQSRSPEGYKIMRIYDSYIQESLKRGITPEGY